MSEREPGFYWVKPVNGEDWQICRWNGYHWHCTHYNRGSIDVDWSEIGERVERRKAMAELETGYYWVRTADGHWEIAKLLKYDGRWRRFDYVGDWNAKFFDEIGERVRREEE